MLLMQKLAAFFIYIHRIILCRINLERMEKEKMGLLIATIIVGVVILLAAIIAGIVTLTNGDGAKGFGIAAFIPLAALLLLFGCFRDVGANQVGIIKDDRYGIVEKTYGEGFGTKSIFEHLIKISTSNRDAKITTTGQTNDGQYATFDLSMIYKVEKENAGKFYKAAGKEDIPEAQLESLVKKCLQSSTINFNIFELLSEGLEVARLDFYEDLRTTISTEYYITLVSVSFDDVDAGPEIEAILQAKAEADQKIEIAQKEAEAAMITAQNQAEIQKLLADAEAYATRITGEASGEAASAYVAKIMAMIDSLYENMGGALTYTECAQIVLSIIFYDTWNGELPEVLTGDALEGLIGGLIAGAGSSESGGGEVNP